MLYSNKEQRIFLWGTPYHIWAELEIYPKHFNYPISCSTNQDYWVVGCANFFFANSFYYLDGTMMSKFSVLELLDTAGCCSTLKIKESESEVISLT